VYLRLHAGAATVVDGELVFGAAFCSEELEAARDGSPASAEDVEGCMLAEEARQCGTVLSVRTTDGRATFLGLCVGYIDEDGPSLESGTFTLVCTSDGLIQGHLVITVEGGKKKKKGGK